MLFESDAVEKILLWNESLLALSVRHRFAPEYPTDESIPADDKGSRILLFASTQIGGTCAAYSRQVGQPAR